MPTALPSLTFDHIIAPDGFGRYVESGETWSRPGSNGVHFRTLGNRGTPVTVTGRSFFDTESAANTFIDDVDDSIMTEVTLEDTHNDIEVDCLIKTGALIKGRPQRVNVAGAFSGDWMVEYRLQIVRTG